MLANLSIDASITSILDLYSTYGCRISVLNVTIRLQRDLIRFTKQNHLTNAIAIDETCFTSTILSARVGVTSNTRLKTPKMLSRVKCPRCLRSIEKVSSLRRQSRATQQYIIFASFNASAQNKKLVLDNVASISRRLCSRR
jgi:hypothetical protein